MTSTTHKLIVVAFIIIAAITACTAAAIITHETPKGSVVFQCPVGLNMEDHAVFVALADSARPFDMPADLETTASNAIDAGYKVVPFTGVTGESVRWPLAYGEYVAIVRDSDNNRMILRNFEITGDEITYVVIG